MSARPLNVLSLQPWYGGSHRQFADGWASRSQHRWTTIGLPAKNWKWRMRYATVEFANRINNCEPKDQTWDVVFCSDMMNAAELNSLCRRVTDLPVVVYFHENQFAYPNRGKQQSDHHFLVTNMVSALAADEIWFNSRFNRDSFLKGLQSQRNEWPDFPAPQIADSIFAKSQVFHPPISPREDSFAKEAMSVRRHRVASGAPLHLVWAARWEFDKNPDSLLKCLELLTQQRVPFELSVIGENPDATPHAFEVIRSKFDASIVNWGYQESREQYWSVLNSADIFISTAQHEFFGLSVAEAISLGAFPLLPCRLSYPELIDIGAEPCRAESFTYQESAKHLATRIRELHRDRQWNWQQLEQLSNDVRNRYSFGACVPKMDDRLREVAGNFHDAD